MVIRLILSDQVTIFFLTQQMHVTINVTIAVAVISVMMKVIANDIVATAPVDNEPDPHMCTYVLL